MAPRSLQLGPWNVGERPLVVGTIATLDGLLRAAESEDLGCDVAEVRLDLIGLDTLGWMGYCEELQALGLPVLLTLRHVSEGGAWDGLGSRRLQVLERAVRAISAFDVELRHADARSAAQLASAAGKAFVASCHDFEGTPEVSALEAWVETARECGADLIKIATRVRQPEDEACLVALLDRTRGAAHLCVQAMGTDAAAARCRLARAGSCLVYGYLDRAVAPGQVSARELRDALRASDAEQGTPRRGCPD